MSDWEQEVRRREALSREQEKLRTVKITYCNHSGETAQRTIVPRDIYFGDGSPWHAGEQWLLLAWDVEKQAERTFALAEIIDWEPLA